MPSGALLHRKARVQFHVRFKQNKVKKAEKDTRVVIEGLSLDEIQFHKFLFLRKPSGTTLPSVLKDSSHETEGYILLDGPFQHTIFIAGIFIRKEKEKKPGAPTSGFHYGYSLPAGVSINRDRTLVDDEEKLAEHTFKLWKLAFKSENSSKALRLYMELFEMHKLCQDIRYAEQDLSDNPEIAKLLFKELKTIHGSDCWFYNGDDEDAQTDERIIRRSLGKDPKRIPGVIWEVLLDLGIVMSPEQAGRKAFGDSAASEYNADGAFSPFIRHTLHLFKCFLSLHTRTRKIFYEFKTCGRRIDIDIIKAKPNQDPDVKPEPDSNDPPLFYLNDRTLSVTKAHAVDNGCQMHNYAVMHLSNLEEIICDCAAHKLIALIEDEVLTDEKSHLKQHLIIQRNNIAALMPYKVTCRLEDGEFMIRWQVRGSMIQHHFLLRICEISRKPERLFCNVTDHDVEMYSTAELDPDSDIDDEDVKVKGEAGSSSPPGEDDHKVKVEERVKDEQFDEDIEIVEHKEILEPQELPVNGEAGQSSTIDENDPVVKIKEPDNDEQSDADTESVKDKEAHETHELFFRASHMFWNFNEHKPATQYMVQVRADNAKAFFSVPVQFSTPPRAPSNVSVSRQQDSFVKVHWDISDGADSYRIVFDGDGTNTFEVENGETIWSGILPSNANKVTVYARCTDLETQSSGTARDIPAYSPEPLSEAEPVHVTFTDESQRTSEPSNRRSTSTLLVTAMDDFDDDSENEPFPFIPAHIDEPISLLNTPPNLATPILPENHLPLPSSSATFAPHNFLAERSPSHEVTNKRKRQTSFSQSRSPEPLRRRTDEYSFGGGVNNLPLDYDVAHLSSEDGIRGAARQITTTSYVHQSMKRPGTFSTVNIFCGAGGASLGFTQAGFSSILSVDTDFAAVSTFQRNFPDARVHHQPAEDYLADVIEKKVESPTPAVVIISSLCQPLEDEGKRNRLVESLGASLQAYQPPHCVLFGSSRLTEKQHKDQLDAILLQFLQKGYSVSYKLLAASDYRVPQNEEYLVIFGSRSGLTLPDWPERSQGLTMTVRDAIADLAYKNNRGAVGEMSTDVTGFGSYPSNLPLEQSTYAYNLAESSRQHKLVYNHLTDYKPFSEPQPDTVKVDFEHPANKIMGVPSEKWACVHPECRDVLTIRELAQLMSYPDDFIFQGELKDQYRLVGNSVPPSLARACGEKVKERLLEQWPELDSN